MRRIIKIVSILLTAILVLGNSMFFGFTQITANAEATANTITLDEFLDRLGELVRTYTEDTQAEKLLASGDDSMLVTLQNRLIVKTGSNEPLSTTCGAVDMIEGYNCLHILQYSSKTEADAAYDYFNSQEYVEYVEFDFNFESPTSEATETSVSDGNNGYLSWGSDATGSKTLLGAISKYNIPLNDEVIVAVFDSGCKRITHFLMHQESLTAR